MRRLKDETLSIRTSAEVKQLLRMAAEREHRSIASMMEVLILHYAQEHALTALLERSDGRTESKRPEEAAKIKNMNKGGSA
ncbi:MAG: hypothetical protein ACK4LR_09555 [Acidovorax temperans]|uniref:hypothetical protein n=1 Tax=Acidovorax temperans TaxID=80878 RepID=UPI003918F1FE